MEFAEALQTLGIGEENEWQALSAEALKRAYLKKVRDHRPERDPVGFQQVREAYELLRALGSARVAFRGTTLSTPSSATSAESATPTTEGKAEDAERIATGQKSEPGRSAFDRLHQALAAQQYDAAGDALIEIYSGATLASRQPAPHLVLSVITKQFTCGAQDQGRQLFLAFEQDMARMNVPLSPQLAAIWKLLAELVTLDPEMPQAVVAALAGAIESGDFQQATETLRAALRAQSRQDRLILRRSLQTSAPTLYEAVWPGRAFFRKQQRNGEAWAHLLLALVVLASSSAIHILEAGSSRRASQSQTARARSSEHDSARQTNLGALSAEQSKHLDLVTSKLEKVLRFSRCHQLRAVWAEYTSVVGGLKGYESVMPRYERYRADAGTTCPQLASELPESP